MYPKTTLKTEHPPHKTVVQAPGPPHLLRRKVYPVVPPKTEYTLTPLGQRIHEPIASLCRWAIDHPEDLRAIEVRRDRAEGSIVP
jgi:hypothetical protein